jgi:hypothetical protein
MHPLLLVGLIVGGLVLIDVLLRFAGNKSGGRLSSEAEALDAFYAEHPELDASAAGRVIVTPDRRNAFIELPDGGIGLVRGLGDRFVVRQVGKADVADTARSGENALTIRFHDVTLRRLRFDFATAADRDFVSAALGQS